MHSRQVIEQYEAPEAVFEHSVLLITINRSASEKDSVYDAVRYAWKLDPEKARRAELVLAVQQGVIVGVFVADKWMEATTTNFPGTASDRLPRWGFVGREASADIVHQYIRHRVPDSLRKRGAANPVRYASTLLGAPKKR
jgi:uncharacterized protein